MKFRKISFAYRLKRRDFFSVLGMAAVLGLLFLLHGVDYHPGVSEKCTACRKDVGSLARAGHYEEMLWNGVLHVYHSSNPTLRQFTTSNNLMVANDQKPIKNCIDCHNDSASAEAPSLGDLWVRYPRLDKKTGRIIDFEKAVQYEFINRYGGTKPFYNDVRITEIMVYAYEKARQKHLVFNVEPKDGKPLSDTELAALSPSFTCQGVFKKYGNPKGDIAPYIVKGCNIFTDTKHHRPAGYGFWKVNMNCTSCHLYGGTKEYAANIADGVVNYPGVYSSNNMVYTNRMRIARCYAHSINELLYGSNSEYYKLITLYMAWIAEKINLPIGAERASRGVHNIRGTAARHASNMAGQRAYVKYCEKCHGPAGYGTDRFDDNPNFNPPPINGSTAFIKRATMSYSSRMASFILYNMPPGATHDEPVLTTQEALDIAEFMSVQSRPSSTRRNNLEVFYNYVVNRIMQGWFSEKTRS